jgi:hypothetical protein
MDSKKSGIGVYNPIIAGFLSGFLSTWTFHQMGLWVLWHTGIAPFGPYAMHLVPPFGMPAVISLAFWGGVWGILLAFLLRRPGQYHRYWLTAFLFGAILPSLVAFFLVLPLKGRPIAGGWHWPLLMTGFIINGLWGLGTGVFLKLFLPGFIHRAS